MTNVWEEVVPMTRARHIHGVAVLDGTLYAVGGAHSGHNNAHLNSVERYVPAANAWEAVAPMASVRAYPGCVSV